MPVSSKVDRQQNTQATRQSPRKRKHTDLEPDSITQPNRHELLPEDVKEKPRGKSKNTNKKLKKDVVLDESSKTDLVEQHDDEPSPSGTLKLHATASKTPLKKAEVNDKDHIANSDDSSSDLSSIPENLEDDDQPKKKNLQRKKRTKEDIKAENMPLAPRSSGLNMFVGAHVSIAKGVENAITNAVHIGGNALALFLQSQRKWENPDLKPENRDAFLSACSHHHFDAKQHIVPHGSYLVNLAAKDPDQATKSYNFFLKDLKRCEALGIRYYNFHPGATNKDPLPDAIKRLAQQLNQALSETSTVIPLLENMAGTETIIGSRFTDLAAIIAEVKPEYQGRIGVCIDTCHTFAAGYDLRTAEAYQKTFQQLDETVGLKYLKAMHINDSKGMFNSKKDLHQNIGMGFLGLRPFHSIMNDPRLANIPLILETPCERSDPQDPKKTIDDKTVWSREIKLLESLIGMDPEGSEYKQLEGDLAKQGKAERDKMEQWQADKEKKVHEKDEKARKKLDTASKGQKDIAGMFKGSGTKKKAKVASNSEDSASE